MEYFPRRKIEKNLFDTIGDSIRALPTGLKLGLAATGVIGSLVVCVAIRPDYLRQTPLPQTTVYQQTQEPTVQEVPFENPYVTMRLLPSSSFDGNLRVQLLGAGQPIYGQEFSIYSAVKDITGMWSTTDNYLASYETNGIGEITVDIPSGDYVLLHSNYPFDTFLSGGWGIPIREKWYPPEGIPFTLVPGQELEITLNLGVLDVGLLNENGSAEYEFAIYSFCQSKDVAGNIVIDESRCFRDGWYRQTDNRGLVRFVLGLGPYMICTDIPYFWKTPYWKPENICVTDITVNPGEYKEMRIVKEEVQGVNRIKDWWWE